MVNREPQTTSNHRQQHTREAFIHREPIGASMEGPSVRINAEVSTENALVVACFPSVGMVSSVVAHFLIEHLELEFIGGVIDARLPALTLVDKGVPLPPIRAYAGKPKCTIEGCDQVILLMSELVVPEALAHDIVWAMFEWSKEQNIVAGVVIDAFAKSGMKGNLNGSEPVVDYEDTEGIDVVGIGANEKSRKRLEDMKVPLLQQGVIKGINASILGEARRRGLDLMSIMVEADPRFPDARAAATLIENLNNLLPSINLPHQPLIEEAEFLEAQLQSMMDGANITNEPKAGNSMLYG